MKTIEIKVKPRARMSRLLQQDDGRWRADLKSAPVDGKANEELIALVAREFGVTRARVSLRSGASGRTKLVRIDD
jgi:hypothetical protein